MDTEHIQWISFERMSERTDHDAQRTDAERDLVEAAAASHGRIEPMTEVLRHADERLPLVGQGQTRRHWELLATVASQDLVAARVLEPHLDATTILEQAGVSVPQGLLGVYASESGGQTVRAIQPGSAWRLNGTKPWCSLGSVCSAAVVTAIVGDEDAAASGALRRRAFLVDLEAGRQSGAVRDSGERWPALGLSAVTSTALEFHEVNAVPVGDPGWYLTRPGFAWGGISVAACWFGGAIQLMRTLQAREPRDDFAAAAWGRADRMLAAAAALMTEAARHLEQGTLDGDAAEIAAERLRGTIAETCTEVIRVVGEATGPGPLAGDAAHARAVADLQLYVRQHHAGRDDARLGRLLAERPGWSW